ncbi:MAG: aminoacyl-tRNA hydrolase [Jatrophihabitans sp.]|nr:MAG: aminoacyl-tRNA hydrolase [Jatrophihabitans sp.]
MPAPTPERHLVVGLGNPGPRYAGTRHNAGFLVLDLLAGRLGGRFKAHRGTAQVLEGRLAGVPVVLAKPTSFMNTSGGPIVSVSRFYKIPVERLTVVHDDLDLPYGALRLKRGGGDGGHNGLRSASAALGSKEYARVRFGIGRPPGQMDAADYVLREFTAAERTDLAYLVDRAADAVEAVLCSGLEAAQNEFN